MTIPSSRFQRGARPTSETDEMPLEADNKIKPEAAPPVQQERLPPQKHTARGEVHSHNHGTPEELAELQNRLNKVQRERLQREVELKAAAKALQECEEMAKKLNIHSLEEMEAYVQRLQEEDVAALNTFEEKLATEEELLKSIAQQMADLERE